ncbi:12384_t:CDS:1, partial [Cetraspora pellucida]
CVDWTRRVDEFKRLPQNNLQVTRNPHLVEPGNCYENGMREWCVKGGNAGQFDSVRGVLSKEKDERSKIEFVPPQVLSRGADPGQVVEWSMEKGAEQEKGPETYTSWKVLIQNSWSIENKGKAMLVKWDKSQSTQKRQMKRSTLYLPQWNETL